MFTSSFVRVLFGFVIILIFTPNIKAKFLESTKFEKIHIPDLICNVLLPPYNAKGDGNTNDTQAIQQAFNDCGKTGGTIYLPGTRH